MAERNEEESRSRARAVSSPGGRHNTLAPPQPGGTEHNHDDSNNETSEFSFAGPRRSATSNAGDFRSPQRRSSNRLLPVMSYGQESNLRRRSTAASRRSAVEGRPSTLGGRSRLNTLAGPEETPALQTAHEPYVHPGYAEINPSYEQPANAKPVWSLAKPLPRVLRPGMIPTKSEVIEDRRNPELPGENSQKQGIDVNPNDLEEGRLQVGINPAKVSAQVKDARAQRENNLINSIQRRGTTRQSRPGRASSTVSQNGRRQRVSFEQRPLTPTGEQGEEQEDDSKMEQFPQYRPEDLEPISESQEQAVEDGDDGASVDTLAVDDDPSLWADMDQLGNENLPLVDEVHNNHTTFSVYRTQHREFLAELLAVYIQLLIGFSADLAVTLSTTNHPDTTAWAWGIATMIAIYISGGISGAHLNAAITTMLWFFRGFPKRKIPDYVLAQFLGAFLAAFTAYGLYATSISEYLLTNDNVGIVNSFVTNQRYPYIGAGTAFLNEFIGSMVLATTVLALGDDQNAPPGAGMNAFIIGLVVTQGTMAFAFQTGAALNPTRDFGPRLMLLCLGYGGSLFTNPYWFYGPIAATLCGAFVGAGMYDTAIFTGGESPINYPWTRTKRAARKSKAKWRRRLRLHKKKSQKEVEAVRNDGPWMQMGDPRHQQ